MTDYKEYMKTLEEQIQNKRARALVSEEINGHIEEQAQGYEEEGMSREDAKREAVRQMGDPVETGCAIKPYPQTGISMETFCAGGSFNGGIYTHVSCYFRKNRRWGITGRTA